MHYWSWFRCKLINVALEMRVMNWCNTSRKNCSVLLHTQLYHVSLNPKLFAPMKWVKMFVSNVFIYFVRASFGGRKHSHRSPSSPISFRDPSLRRRLGSEVSCSDAIRRVPTESDEAAMLEDADLEVMASRLWLVPITILVYFLWAIVSKFCGSCYLVIVFK